MCLLEQNSRHRHPHSLFISSLKFRNINRKKHGDHKVLRTLSQNSYTINFHTVWVSIVSHRKLLHIWKSFIYIQLAIISTLNKSFLYSLPDTLEQGTGFCVLCPIGLVWCHFSPGDPGRFSMKSPEASGVFSSQRSILLKNKWQGNSGSWERPKAPKWIN